jgi:fructokinase
MPVPGGSPYNTAIAAARLEVPTAYLGRISDDFFGDMLVSNLEHNHVDPGYIRRSSEPTTLAFVKQDEHGDAQYAFYTNGSADRNLSPGDIPDTLPSDAKALLFGSISLTMEPGATTITDLIQRESSVRTISFDPNIRPTMIPDRAAYLSRFETWASAATIVKISDADLGWLYDDITLDEAGSRILDMGACLVVVTKGKDGASARTRDYTVEVPAIPTRVADTIGAGDSFHAGLISWLHLHDKLDIETVRSLKPQDARSALGFAANVSSITCSRSGANPPYLSELE